MRKLLLLLVLAVFGNEIEAQVPFGWTQTPITMLCGQIGVRATTLPVNPKTVLAQMDQAHKCNSTVLPNIGRNQLKNSQGKLSTSTAISYLSKWPWDGICSRMQQGWVRGPYIGDDVAKTKEWGYEMPVILIKLDTIAVWVRNKCKYATPIMRARPTQMQQRPNEGRPDSLKWRGYTTGWAQWAGAKRHGPVQDFTKAEVAAAKRQKLGITVGVNMLYAGCGPRPADCPSGVTGSRYTDGQYAGYEVSGSELNSYMRKILADPYVCGSWSWVYPPKYNRPLRPDVVAAAKAIAPVAKAHPATSCKQR